MLAQKVRAYDAEMDITDLWNDYMDPENERGEIATAYFDIVSHIPDEFGDFTIDVYKLVAVGVEDGKYSYSTYYDYSKCVKMFGQPRVTILEDMMTEMSMP